MRVPSEKFLPAKIIDRRNISDDLFVLHVEAGAPFSYLAGQYATLGVEREGKRIERPYSICSSPYESVLEFFVELVPHGEFTPVLNQLDKGTDLLLRRFAKGRFTLDLRSGRKKHLLLATVTGLDDAALTATVWKDRILNFSRTVQAPLYATWYATANNATLGGHVEVGDFVFMGGLCAVHQFTRIGRYAFVGAGTVVTKDVPDFALVLGNPGRVVGWMCRCGIRLQLEGEFGVDRHLAAAIATLRRLEPPVAQRPAHLHRRWLAEYHRLAKLLDFDRKIAPPQRERLADFGEERIAARFSVNAEVLAEIARRGQGLMNLRQAHGGPKQEPGFLLAARDDSREQKPPEGAPP